MSDQLPYRIELDHRLAVVSLLPELNEVPWADIEKVGSEIIGRIQGMASPQLLVDLCSLSYMGSAQVALVVRMYKLVVVEKKGKMVVANRDPMVLEVLKLSGLTKVWTIVDSRERAASMLGGGSLGASVGSGGGGAVDANPLPGAIAIVAAVAAAVFIVLHLANPALIPSRGDVFGILGGSVVAFLTGLWAMSSGKRGLGVGVVVLSVAMLLYGVFEIAKPQTSAGSPTPIEETPAAGATDTKEGDKKADVPAAAPGATPPGVDPGVVDPAKAAAPPPAPAGAPPADPTKAAVPKDAPAAPKTTP